MIYLFSAWIYLVIKRIFNKQNKAKKKYQQNMMQNDDVRDERKKLISKVNPRNYFNCLRFI